MTSFAVCISTRTKLIKGFTSRYAVVRLVCFEGYDDPTSAITREKELKK